MPKFLQRDQSQLYLLPPDLRDWLPEDDLARFVIEAVERVPMESFRVNERGTGSAQYHPRTMLALLVYCYANGIFGSRRIERATYRDIGVRYVAANCHADHDTICTFRRNNFEAVAEAFLQVLLLAKELKLLRVGTVSVDGTKVDANANKRNSIRYDRAAPRTLAPWPAMEHARTAARLSLAYRPSTLSAVCRPTVAQAGQVANCSGFVLHACRWAVALDGFDARVPGPLCPSASASRSRQARLPSG